MIKDKIFLASLCLSCIFLFAEATDSLSIKLKQAKHDTEKIYLLNYASEDTLTFNPEKSLRYANEALALSEKIRYANGTAYSLVNIGTAIRVMGNYDKSLDYYFRALKEYEQLQNKRGIARCYSKIGVVHYFRGNLEKTIDYYTQSLHVFEELNDSGAVTAMLNNTGLVYSEQKNYSKAIEFYSRALKIAEAKKNKTLIASVLNNIGSDYMLMKDYDNAAKNIRESLEIFYQLQDKSGIASGLTTLGNIYSEKNAFSTAIDFLKKGLEASKEVGYKEYVKAAYSSLAANYSKQGDYKNAYEYHKLYSETKDSLLNEESSKQITEMQTKYDTEKKEQQITLLNKDKELQSAELNRQKIIIWSVASGLLVVLTLSIFIFRERKKSEKLLLNILPAETARELKANGKATAKQYESVTVMFTDFKGFTAIAEKLSAEELVSELDFLFKKFDEIISKYPIEKIKTIGDAYMCAGGLPTANTTNAMDVIRAALEIQHWMNSPLRGQPQVARVAQGGRWQLRIGIHTGPVTAGVVGDKKFAYDIWGDTVNTASRMESSGEPGKINISGSTYELLKNSPLEGGQGGMSFIHRGKIPAKNKGEIEMYFVESNMQS